MIQYVISRTLQEVRNQFQQTGRLNDGLRRMLELRLENHVAAHLQQGLVIEWAMSRVQGFPDEPLVVCAAQDELPDFQGLKNLVQAYLDNFGSGRLQDYEQRFRMPVIWINPLWLKKLQGAQRDRNAWMTGRWG